MPTPDIIHSLIQQLNELKREVADLKTQQSPLINDQQVLYGGPTGNLIQEPDFYYDDGNQTLHVPEISITNLNGENVTNETKYRHAQNALVWGSPVTLSASYELKWQSRILCLPADRSMNSNGYLELNMPSVGTTITGYGGASSKVVNSNGIQLDNWVMLIGEHSVGGLATTITYKLLTFSSAFAGSFPSNWIILAVRNADQNAVMLANANIIYPGETFVSNRLNDVGSSFPSLWPTNRPFYNTSQLRTYAYDGTNWVSDYYPQSLLPYFSSPVIPAASITTNTILFQGAMPFGRDLKGIVGVIGFMVATTHDNSNLYTITIEALLHTSTTTTATTLGSFNTRVNSALAGAQDSASFTYNTIYTNSGGANKYTSIRIRATKTGSPGALSIFPNCRLRFKGD